MTAALDERKRHILLAVVQEYITTAEPVGSRSLARRHLSQISAATIRNEMADLEEMGYLEQPHTSAGRVPSDKGYRYYVDHMLGETTQSLDSIAEGISAEAQQGIDRLRLHYASGMKAVEEIVLETSQLLSTLTNYISLVSAPSSQQSSLYRVQLVEMGAGQAVAMLVTNTGHIANRVIQVPPEADQAWLNQVSEFLSKHLHGRPLQQLAADGMMELRLQLAGQIREYEMLFDLLLELVSESTPEKLYLGSTTQILTLPEFQDLDRTRKLLSFIEADQRLQQLLIHSDDGTSSVQVRIGREHSVQDVEKLSLVSAAYKLHGRPLGYLGILGPTRMDYAQVVTIVREVSNLLSEALGRTD